MAGQHDLVDEAKTAMGHDGKPLFERYEDIDVTVTDDDSAATNGTALYAAFPRAKVATGVLMSELANHATVYETATKSDGDDILIPFVFHNVDELTLQAIDDDSADSNGTALYVVLTGQTTPWGADIAQLQSVTANDADAVFQDADTVDSVMVHDNDGAATAGPAGTAQAAAVYIDEDATAATSRLLATNPSGSGNDMYVHCESDGESTTRFLKITHHADPSTPGVQLYFDDNAANEEERLLFVSPTNANMTNGEFGNQLGWWNATERGFYLAALYFDEDADTEGRSRILADIPVERDAYIGVSGNRAIKVTHDASASSNGVQLYVNDDADAGSRILFVSPTDSDGTFKFDNVITSLGVTNPALLHPSPYYA